MAIKVSQAFQRTSANPIDESLTLTKAQMKTVNDNLMPSKYFTVGQDDGYIYLYDKSNTVDPTTGKYRKFEGGGGGGASSMSDLDDVLLTTLEEGQTLIWDDTEEKWVNGTVTAVTKLENLTDVNITDPANGQLLKYDDTSGKWINGSGGSGGGHTIEDAEGATLTQRDTLQFGEGLLAEDDDTNEKTVVALDSMPSEDMDEIVDVYPTVGELVSIVNAFNRSDLYSTDEKMIGQWYDGKPLYQKTVSTGATSSEGVRTVPHNISNLDICVNMRGILIYSTGITEDLPLIKSSSAYIRLQCDATNITVAQTGSFSTGTASYVTLQYTKTTDTAISIGTETEYSTDEKVVGTWITGEPIYQKTIQTTTPNCVTYGVIVEKVINLNVELDKIIKVEGFVYDGATYVCMPINSALQNSKDAVYMLRAYCYGNGASSNPNSIVIGNSIKDYNDKPCYVTVQYVKSTT